MSAVHALKMPRTSRSEESHPDIAESRILEALEAVLAPYGERDFTVRLWDGSVLPAQKESRCTLVLNSRDGLRRMLGTPLELRLGEAFIRGDWDVEGDILHMFNVAEKLVDAPPSGSSIAKLLAVVRIPSGNLQSAERAARLSGRRHSAERDGQAIRHHYDVGNDFYRLWLDSRMVYSCAYFEDGCVDLDDAQVRKLDYICRKLRLRPGQRLLDIGCGWGALVRHAAREYGVEAVGITLSPAQVEIALERIDAEALSDRARVELVDYRDADRYGTFDAIASVGMFEHVGAEKLLQYFKQAYELLREGGVFLNHGISREIDAPPWSNESFINRYVFPDGELVPISKTLQAAEEAGFEIRDVESLREHYAATLTHWVRRLEEREAEAVAAADATVYRIWRLYMAGSVNGFARGNISVFQSLLLKPAGGLPGLPMTRNDWYTA